MGNPASSFQEWIDIIKRTVMDELVPALAGTGMAITEKEFIAASPADTPYNLINIADFNSLIAQSQKYSTPIFALSDVQIDQRGVILQTMKESRDAFRKSFDSLANSIEIIAGV